jgi:acetyl-CoA C-acetyltransferase
LSSQIGQGFSTSFTSNRKTNACLVIGLRVICNPGKRNNFPESVMGFKDIVLLGGVRSAFGDFGRSLRDVPLSALSAHVVKACIARSGVPADALDHLVYGITGVVDHDGPFISRKVALEAGLPQESAALTVTRACGSGTQSIVSAAQQIASGHSQLAVAAGGESFSRVPHLVEGARYGVGRGPSTLVDGLDYIYRCPFSKLLMGDTAELLAERFGYQRAEMDAWGLMSQQRAQSAIENGFLARQIVPIEVREKKASRLFDQDEFPRFNLTLEKLMALRPAFKANGTVTAGSSSGVTDGAAALIVARRDALPNGAQAQAQLVDYAVAGVPPEIMGCGPVPAIAKLLKQTGLQVADVDYFEINEAFAVVNLHAERQLGISRDKTNLYGGGISIGHPPGATGLRMTITAMHHLADTGGRYGVISMCLGSGMGMAVLIENLRR